MKRILLTILLGLIALPAIGQETRRAYFVLDYDLDSASYIFCAMTGTNGSPFGSPIPGSSTLVTSGSSTTVTEGVTDALPFALLSVGDVLFIGNGPDTPVIRRITAKASGASVTVDTAVDLGTAGRQFGWKKTSCGTAASDGWIDVSSFLFKKVTVHLRQMDATSIDIKWEGRDLTYDTQPEYVYPGSNTATGTCPGGTSSSGACNYTAASEATNNSVEVDIPFDQLRVGMKINTDDGADTTTHTEIISAWVTVWGQK